MTEKMIKLIQPVVGKEELALIGEVLESGYMTEGPKTKEFESKFAEYVGASHGIATTSCTTAMELCLRVLGMGEGDEVIVPDFTYPATADVVRFVGATPVLVDVSLESYNVHAEHLREAITPRTRCVMPVSLFGNPIDIEPIEELKEEHGFSIVEDAACSTGARRGERRTGSMADMTCFSFHPRKVITTGEGGMITTSVDDYAELANSIKKFGMATGAGGVSQFTRAGSNYKLSDILGAIGVVQLSKADEIISRRRELALNYYRLLEGADGLVPPKVDEEVRHVYQTYAVRITVDGARDRLINDLRERNIQTQIGTYSLHVQPSFSDVRRIGSLATSKLLFENLLALPLSHYMTDEDQEYVVSSVSELLSKYQAGG
ncbi:MAG: DegT/DnrJ/EryC1/StrS family aminotransferase [Thermoplasmata archaeon]|nr:DegT/DnrJ/EryC1/StrS family aminotransferase [Thermoplasmata archaeon]